MHLRHVRIRLQRLEDELDAPFRPATVVRDGPQHMQCIRVVRHFVQDFAVERLGLVQPAVSLMVEGCLYVRCDFRQRLWRGHEIISLGPLRASNSGPRWRS
jgi:hypothetical protein